MKLYKKGFAGMKESMSMIVRILTTTVLMGLTLYMLSLATSLQFESASIESSVIAQRLVYARGGISNFDPVTGRVKPLEIDVNRFQSPALKSQLNTIMQQGDEEEYAARIFLTNANGDPIAETYYNEGKYQVWHPIGDAEKTASARRSQGDIQRFDYVFNAVARDGSRIFPADLNIHIYHPKGTVG